MNGEDDFVHQPDDDGVRGAHTGARLAQTIKDFTTYKSHCKHLTGLSFTAWNLLCTHALPLIVKFTNRGERAKIKTNPDTWTVSPKEQLLLTMVWLKLYQPLWVLSFTFALPIGIVRKSLKRVMSALVAMTKDPEVEKGLVCAVKWPNQEEFKDIVTQQAFMQPLRDVRFDMALDGMHLPIRSISKGSKRKSKAQLDEWIKLTKNGKHKVAATNLLVVVSMHGKFLRVEGPFVGQEGTQLKQSTLAKDLVELGASIVADAGLHVTRQDSEFRPTHLWTVGPSMINLCTTIFANADKIDDEVVVTFRKLLASTRVASRMRCVVENSIGIMRRFASVSMTFRHWCGDWCTLGEYSVTQEDVVTVVAWLANFLMIHDGAAPRAEDWEAKTDDLRGLSYSYPCGAKTAKELEKRVVRLIAKDGDLDGRAGPTAVRSLVEKKIKKGEEVKLISDGTISRRADPKSNKKSASKRVKKRQKRSAKESESVISSGGVSSDSFAIQGAHLVRPEEPPVCRPKRVRKPSQRSREMDPGESSASSA